ncbi:hypothetical protein STIUS_v1c03560 [Spiroplasma sp. TIUS-1]|uniref:hypothetical protein n=1 Tax=Spiroplasma sp. TIUS-1 TaxID=216963 RepID=UPI0013986DE1|nr:hypothetical protein [Spiroplasma sp. TIUS-1]QHX35910.1 hypothetical protein STIUS_v1c03560 [Spiroplasma sp. TIUS-1]
MLRKAINQHQFMDVDITSINQELTNIKFPALILDCEFLNVSHKPKNNEFEDTLDIKRNEDKVFLLQFSIIRNFKDLIYRNNQTAIKHMDILRNYKEKKYDFEKAHKSLVNSFLNVCKRKNIRTIICADTSAEKKLITSWLLKDVSPKISQGLAFFNKDKSINMFDIYKLLKLAKFNNLKKDGSIFDATTKDKMIDLQSSKKIMNYYGKTDKLKPETSSIYEICINAYKYYSIDHGNINVDEFVELGKYLKEARDHCYNDVFMVAEILKFFKQLLIENQGQNGKK